MTLFANRHAVIIFLILVIVSIQKPCRGFSPPESVHYRYRTNAKHTNGNQQIMSKPLGYQKDSFLSRLPKQRHAPLFQSRKGGTQVDGTGRGLAVFSLVMAACIWVFSIPPEFRRAHFCVVEKCVQERSKCYDCVTISEWMDGVTEYYQNGGGVQFDFTVAEETKALWKGTATK